MHRETGSFNPSRLTVARKRRGISKISLAEQVGVDRRAITGFELGEYPPSKHVLTKLAFALGFPKTFFFGDDLEEPHPDAVSFRALSKMTASQRDMALGEGTLALSFNRWLEGHFNLPSPSLPDLSKEQSPEEAAIAIRHGWGYGSKPIPNLIHLLESKGVRVFSLCIDSLDVDAFSMWNESTPLIFLNTLKSAEHSRFDAAHELGHLVLHRHAAPKGQTAERQANEFASALLMPKESILSRAPKFAVLPTLVELKRIWGVSVAALVYRMHQLGILSDWHYRQLYVELGSRGYRISEPSPMPRETSQVFPKVFTALKQNGISKADVAEQLCVYEQELDQLIFRLMLTSLRGGKSPFDGAPANKSDQLRLIE